MPPLAANNFVGRVFEEIVRVRLAADSGDVNGRFRRCEYSRSEATLADAMMPEFIHIGQWGGDLEAN
jgi:predicted Zn-dependent protease